MFVFSEQEFTPAYATGSDPIRTPAKMHPA